MEEGTKDRMHALRRMLSDAGKHDGVSVRLTGAAEADTALMVSVLDSMYPAVRWASGHIASQCMPYCGGEFTLYWHYGEYRMCYGGQGRTLTPMELLRLMGYGYNDN